jgi:pantetheine-phosphate adenylyltransferase
MYFYTYISIKNKDIDNIFDLKISNNKRFTMEKIAVFPGSFDPFTLGHEDIVYRSLPLFDKVIIAIGENSNKNNMLSIEKRIKIINKVFNNNPKISVKAYSGLTINYCKEIGAKYIIRGLRNSLDFEYEKAIDQINKDIDENIETIFFITSPDNSAISSSVLRDLNSHNYDIEKYLPTNISLKDLL